MRRLMTACVPLLLAACASVAPAPAPQETPVEAAQRRAKAPPPAYNLTGYPQAARDGYIDGCESARRSSYARKDETRMAADARYAMGWNDGYSICQKR